MIESALPVSWRDLQTAVATMLREAGLEAEVEHEVDTARGSVNLDVWAVDKQVSPPATIVCECKHWQSAVPKNIIHGFRTVVADIGANAGLVISASGFQSGAYEAATYSNVRLVTWIEFQSIFEERWFQQYFVPIARGAIDPLVEYTEPINSRIFRKADALDSAKQRDFRDLREKYFPIACLLLPILFPVPGIIEKPARPTLPLRMVLKKAFGVEAQVPDSLLDAPDFRSLLGAVTSECEAAVKLFDTLFGERA